jgi:hypothetical protein
MAIRPLGFSRAGVEVWHDEADHGGTVAWTLLANATGAGGAPDPTRLDLPCPGCGVVSRHPVTGGIANGIAQRLFALWAAAHPTAYGLPARPTATAVRDAVYALIEAQRGAVARPDADPAALVDPTAPEPASTVLHADVRPDGAMRPPEWTP